MATTHEQDRFAFKCSPAAEAMHPRKPVLGVEPHLFVVSCHVSQPDRIEALCFGYFHLGPQMKVARLPAETGGLARSEKSWREAPSRRADVALAARILEAAHRFGDHLLGQPEHDLREVD